MLRYGKEVLKMRMQQIIRDVIVLTCTLSVTLIVGEWAIGYAFLERGYQAVGGEFFLIPVVAWLAYSGINILLDVLEDMAYADN